MHLKKSRVLIIALLTLCFMCGCDKKTKEYVIPGALYFDENTTKEEKAYLVVGIRTDRDENNKKFVEDAYLNEDGDIVMVMTEKQRKVQIQSNIECMPMMISFINDDLLGLSGTFSKKCQAYYCDDEMTELYLYFVSREAFETSEYNATIDRILALMFSQQILNGGEREDIQATLYIEFIDTGDGETSTYHYDDLPIAKTTD